MGSRLSILSHFFLIALLVIYSQQVIAANVVTIGQGSGHSGQSGTITVSMDNDDAISGLQFTIRDMPDSLTVTGITLASRLSSFTEPAMNDIDSLGVVRIVIFSFGANAPPGSGPIFTLDYEIAKDTPPGDYPIIVDEVVLSNPQAQNVESVGVDGLFTVLPQITISEHPEGQITDISGGIGIETLILSRFQLLVSEETADVTTVGFSLTGVSGITSGDFAGMTLINDSNGNGLIDPGENASIGGAGSVTINGSEGDISFTSPFSLSPGLYQYILQATVNFSANTGFTVNLAPEGIAATGTSAGVIFPIGTLSGASQAAGNVTFSDHIGAGQVTDQIGAAGIQAAMLLYRFTVTGTGDVSLLTDLTFDLSLSGITPLDLSNITLYEDTDDDGQPNGEPVALNPLLTPDDIAFDEIGLTLSDGISKSFILEGTIDANETSDRIIVSLTPEGIQATDATGNNVPATGFSSDADHVVSALLIDSSPHGQVVNQFTADGVLSDLNLLRFTVTSHADTGIIKNLVLSLILDGLSEEDISDIELYEDTDGDGLPDGDPLATTLLPPPIQVPINAGITFEGLALSVPPDASRTFIIQMTVDTDTTQTRLTVELASDDVTAEDTGGNPVSITGETISSTHLKVSFTSSDADSGQFMNQFEGIASVTNVPLFRFDVQTDTDNLYLERLKFGLSLTQINSEALSTMKLYSDVDGDGLPDGTPHAANVSITSDSLTLSNLAIDIESGKAFVLTGNVSLENVGDALSITLEARNIIAVLNDPTLPGFTSESTGVISSVDHEATGFPGDVNFDLTIDIRDVIKEVGVVLETVVMDGPLAFFDLNGDELVNIVDIVNIIHKILDNDFPTRLHSDDQPVDISIASNESGMPILTMESSYNIAGIQIILSAHGLSWEDMTPENTATELEMAEVSGDGRMMIVQYSMKGNHIPSGSQNIIRFQLPEALPAGMEILLEDVIAVDVSGREVPVHIGNNSFRTAGVPTSYALNQNFPNPFNPSTAIRYDLPEQTHVFLTVYNVIGQQIATLVNDVQPAGRHTVIWDARNETGHPVASGLYVYRITTGNGFSDVRKMLLIR